MASPEELWVGYFYPETFDPARNEGTLRDLLGERDPELLASKEHARAGRRQRELLTGDVDVPRTFDAEHLRGVHRHLFQDVYEWAGQFRTVPIYKAQGAGFASLGDGTVDRLLRDAHRLVEAAPWARLDRDGFAERAADVFAHLNTGGSALSGKELFHSHDWSRPRNPGRFIAAASKARDRIHSCRSSP